MMEMVLAEEAEIILVGEEGVMEDMEDMENLGEGIKE
jgi:hypothetical protein